MKKTLFALATLSLISASAQAQSNVTVYGIIDAGVTYTSKVGPNNDSRLSVDSGGASASRIGFKGTESLDNGMTAIFQLENGFNVDTGAFATANTIFDRKAIIGLSGAFGTVTIGRQTDFLDDIGAKYTSVQTFGGNGVKGGHFNNLDRVAGVRANNSIRFDSRNYLGFTGSLFYGFGEVAGQLSAGQSFGIGGNYANGPFSVGMGYFQTKLAIGGLSIRPGDTDLKTFTLGSSYQVGDAKLYGAWSQVKQPFAGSVATVGLVNITSASKANIVDMGVDYAFSPSVHLLGSVIYDRADIQRQALGSTKVSTTQLNLGVDYILSKRTDLYGFYTNQRANGVNNPGVVNAAYSNAPNDDATQHVLRVGMRHKF